MGRFLPLADGVPLSSPLGRRTVSRQHPGPEGGAGCSEGEEGQQETTSVHG